jgi:hypothetical protein
LDTKDPPANIERQVVPAVLGHWFQHGQTKRDRPSGDLRLRYCSPVIRAGDARMLANFDWPKKAKTLLMRNA